MKRSLFIAVLFLALVLTGSKDIYAGQIFVAELSPRQLTTQSFSSGFAFCKLELNAAETELAGTCKYRTLNNGDGGAFHTDAPLGQDSPPTFPFPFNGGSTGSGEFFLHAQPLTPQQVANLRANRWYIKINTTTNPAGDVRGQLKLANGTYNDYDADGRADLVVYRSSNNRFYALESLRNWVRERQVGQPGDSVSLNVDFDGDAQSDFSTGQLSSQIIWRILKSSNQVLVETHWGNSTLGDFFAAGDYDGDGRSDIAVFRGGDWYIIESATGTVRFDHFGQAGDIPTPNDYDKDGKAELAVARSEGGLRIWYRLNSSNGQFIATQFGLSSDAFFAGRADYDGDGAADISVIRNIGGQRNFYILRSSDQQFQAIQWGLSSDLPKLADYDGDGRTDLAVTRAEAGGKNWYILQSSNGQLRFETWGLPGDF